MKPDWVPLSSEPGAPLGYTTTHREYGHYPTSDSDDQIDRVPLSTSGEENNRSHELGKRQEDTVPVAAGRSRRLDAPTPPGVAIYAAPANIRWGLLERKGGLL